MNTQAEADSSGQNDQPLFPVIGIGFSAGGLDGLKKFLEGIPAENNGAYVVIQHLPKEGDSQLYTILKDIASLRVCKLEDGQKLEPGSIYVLGSDADVVMRDGLVRFDGSAGPEAHHSPIDRFFDSLAHEKAEMVVGVILSGSGTDGTVGLQKIKAAGGMCLAQDPNQAEFPSMPQSAIKCGCVDFVGKADKLAERVDHYFNHRSAHRVTSDSLDSEKESTLIRMLCLVRAKTGNDFRNYKRSSVLRRVERRMSLSDKPDFDDYLEYLRQHDKEVRDLARDILISVTCFFRDPEVWQALENDIFPKIIDAKKDGDEIRVWVPGCATGEEVYSYGILLTEAIERSGKSLILQIYGTDIDDFSREIARAATYPAAIVHDVGEERLHKYFTKAGQGRFTILSSLREKIVFAKQNLLLDPPFSRMDLVSCRNLLIYLDATMQERVINLLHFALNEDGIAVLGSAESTGQQPKGLFKALDRNLRIFKRVGNKSVRLPERTDSLSALQSPLNSSLQLHARPSARGIEETNRSLIMEHFDAASVLVDEQLNIRYLSGKTERYLRHPEGTPSSNLSVLVSATVGQRIRSAAKQVIAENQPCSFVAKLAYAGLRRVRVSLKPVRLEDGEDGLFVLFEAVPEADEAEAAADKTARNGELLGDIDRELKETQDELRISVEDLASANEELKSSNEEVMSMNEELQSSNEELETSKEELQSLNDELTSVNKDLTTKVSELEVTNNDIDNLLSSTNIATVFLDEKLHIKLFTPACSHLFNLIPSDIGRPLSDMVAKFDNNDLEALCRQVLDDLKGREDEIQTKDDTHFLRRITPYRTKENRIEGVVVTFSDVSRLKRTEADLVETERYLRLSIENSPVTIFAQNRDLEYTYILNLPASVSEQCILGKRDCELFPGDFQKLEAMKSRVMETGKTLRERVSVLTQSGDTIWYDVSIEALRGEGDAIVGVVGAAVDMTAQVDREAELKAANEAKSRFLSSMSHDIRTPLTAIMGLSEMLEEILDEEQREIGEEIKNACQHLIGTLDSVLNLAHLQGGRVNLKIESVDLGEILEEVRDTLDPKRNRSNGEPRIRLDIAEAGLHVMAEHGALRRVLGNLLGNALKFCPDSPITLRASREGEEATIEVEDGGPGISREFIKDIFKPFTQESHDQGPSLSGSGLGLSICHELVKLMGGSIQVESEPGDGTTMIVRFPLAGEKGATPGKSTTSKEGAGPLRALICDDHEATCKVIRHLMKGHDVTVVSSEAALYEHLDQAEVLLLDINFHGKNRGVEIMKKLRDDSKHKDLRIIAFTAHALPGQKESFLEAGFDDYMGKPFRRQDLIDKIRPA